MQAAEALGLKKAWCAFFSPAFDQMGSFPVFFNCNGVMPEYPVSYHLYYLNLCDVCVMQCEEKAWVSVKTIQVLASASTSILYLK